MKIIAKSNFDKAYNEIGKVFKEELKVTPKSANGLGMVAR